MIWLLLFYCILLLLISYLITGKDPFAPSCMMIIAFTASSLSAIININKWKFEIGFYTLAIIVFGMLTIVIINALVHRRYCHKRTIILGEYDRPLTVWLSAILFGIMLTALFLQLSYVKSNASGGDINDIMHEYRMKTSYGSGDYSVPSYLTQLNHLTLAISYVCMYNAIVLYRKNKKSVFALNISTIILWCIKVLLNASRFDIFSLIIGAVFVFYTNRMRFSSSFKKHKLALLVGFAAIAVIAVYFFYLAAYIVGRKTNATPIEYITQYSGTPIPNLDLFLKDKEPSSVSFPGETFWSLLQWLRRRGLDFIPEISIHKEFRTISGYSLGNTYTAFRDYYHDFGMVGVLVFHSFFSLLFSFMYERNKKVITNWSTILLAFLYGSIPMYMFNNMFFGSYLSPAFLISVLEAYLIYYFFIRNRNRINLRRKYDNG